MQKLMREMENWRQSMIKAAYIPESIQLREGLGPYVPPQEGYDTTLDVPANIVDTGPLPPPPATFETTPYVSPAPTPVGIPDLAITSQPNTPMGGPSLFAGSDGLKPLPKISIDPNSRNVGTVPATVNGIENPVVTSDTVESPNWLTSTISSVRNMPKAVAEKIQDGIRRLPSTEWIHEKPENWDIPDPSLGYERLENPEDFGFPPDVGPLYHKPIFNDKGEAGYEIAAYNPFFGGSMVPVQSESPEEAKRSSQAVAKAKNDIAEARTVKWKQENQSVHPGESLITTGPNKGVITRGANPQTPVAKNVNGERQDLTKEELDNLIQNDFKSEAEALGLPNGTGLPDHGFIPNPIPQTPINTNPTNWRSIGAGSAIGAGAGGLIGGALGYGLGGKDRKLSSTLLGAGLGLGGGALLGGLGGAYYGNR